MSRDRKLKEGEIDILIDEAKKKEKYFRDYLKYASLIKKEAKKLLGEVRVYVFGSILKRNEVAQDIDVLIISSILKTSRQKTIFLNKLSEKLGFLAPFEIHPVNDEEYNSWYKYFIKEKIEI